MIVYPVPESTAPWIQESIWAPTITYLSEIIFNNWYNKEKTISDDMKQNLTMHVHIRYILPFWLYYSLHHFNHIRHMHLQIYHSVWLNNVIKLRQIIQWYTVKKSTLLRSVAIHLLKSCFTHLTNVCCRYNIQQLYSLLTDKGQYCIKMRIVILKVFNVYIKGNILTTEPGVVSWISAKSHTFMEIDHELISMVFLLLPLIHEGLFSVKS